MFTISLHLKFLVTVLFLQTVTANWKDGKCNNLKNVRPFHEGPFRGRWYISLRSPGKGDSKQCLQLILLERSDVTWPTILMYTESGQKTKVDYNFLTFGSGVEGYTPREHLYRVIATDYRNYAVFYTCPTNGNPEEENVYIFTRKKHPDDSYIKKAKKSFEENGLNVTNLQRIEQDECPSNEEWHKMEH